MKLEQGIYDLGEINFYWRTNRNNGNASSGVPSFLPFSFEYDINTGLLKQRYCEVVSSALEKVYQLNENVGYLQDGHDLADIYSNDFFDFVLNIFDPIDFKNKDFLDIGCGEGYLLRRFLKYGANINGCDPSPIAKESALKNGYHLYNSFFSKDICDKKFDFIIHYDVLEHIYQPSDFLKNQRECLKEEGYLLFTVPDCTVQIQNGDLSMILHEHVNYFEVNSLNNIVQQSGFEIISLDRSTTVGVIHCCAKKNKFPKDTSLIIENNFFDFVEKTKKNIQRIRRELEGAGVGIYVPLRAAPYISIIDKNKELRFFDDSKMWSNGYLDGFSAKVENFTDFLENPPSKVIVFSIPFGEKIRDKIKEHFPSIEIVLISNLLLSENRG